MPYVYKYTDINDGVVKYVGIIKKDTNFPNRFIQHYRDKWYKDGDWKIEYISVESGTDAEALEAHFIWVYGTGEYYNKSKTEWGRCSFAPDPNELKWMLYEEKGMQPFSLSERTTNILNELYSISRKQEELWREYDLIKDWINKESLASIRQWVSDCIIEPEQVLFTWQRNHDLTVSVKSYETLFENYLEWADKNHVHYTIIEIDDFSDVIRRNSRLKGVCKKDFVQNVILIGSDEHREYESIRGEIDKADMILLAKMFGTAK